MKQLVFILLGLAIAVIAWSVLTAFSAALMKQDRARSFANVSLIWNRLDDYRITHGSYPPAQDMTSLLKTLNLSDGDFQKVYFVDIHSAVYYPPAPGHEDPYAYPAETILALPINQLFGGKREMMTALRDGGIRCLTIVSPISAAPGTPAPVSAPAQ